MDQSLHVVLRQAEALLKDKSTQYLVAISDGQDVLYLGSSKVASKGIVDMVATDIKESWKATQPQNVEEA